MPCKVAKKLKKKKKPNAEGKSLANTLILLPVDLLAQVVKSPPTMQETQESHVRSPSQEDSPRVGNGNPLQYSCLGNPMDREAWSATFHVVAMSRT